MRTWTLSLWLCSALCATAIESTAANASDVRLTPQVKAVVRVEPAIVNINTERNSRTRDVAVDGRGSTVHGMGTGIIIDERGYIVTNQHVIADTTSRRVTLQDGSSYSAELISYDIKHDLAIIKIDHGRLLPVAPMGTSSDVQMCETVIAIGNPFGYEHSASLGIISFRSRDVDVNEHQSYKNLLQTDAAINPGNSGGPLVNLDGEVIGINVAIRAGAQRIGFAIPIDDARKYIANLLDIRQLNKTHHGIVAHDVKTPEHRKLVVDAAEQNSPAAAAGFLPGDVVTQVGARPIVDRADLERAFLGQPAGTPIEVVVHRKHEPRTLSMQLAKVSDRKAPPGQTRTGNEMNLAAVENPVNMRIWEILGLKLEKANPTALKPFQPRYKGGMKILEVRSDSPAAKHGIRRGDVLVGLSLWETTKVDDIKWVLDQPKLGTGEEPLKFFVVRETEVMQGEMKLSPSVRR